MKRDMSGKDSSSPRQWRWLQRVVARKTDVIERCHQRSDADCRVLLLLVKSVKS